MKKYNIKCPIRKTNPYRKMVKSTKEHRVVLNLLEGNSNKEYLEKYY